MGIYSKWVSVPSEETPDRPSTKEPLEHLGQRDYVEKEEEEKEVKDEGGGCKEK